LLEPVRERPVQPVEQASVEGVRDRERDRDRRERDDQPCPQLAEVLDERGLLAVAKAPREQAHSLTR
jgi:hypothetical protein